jgi:hypothetical protein
MCALRDMFYMPYLPTIILMSVSVPVDKFFVSYCHGAAQLLYELKPCQAL